MKPLHIHLVQNSATNDPDANLADIQTLLSTPDLRPQTPSLIVLPETCSLRGSRDEQIAHAESPAGPIQTFMSALAREHQSWVLGGILERDNERIYNTLLVLDPSGTEITRYRKIHLFYAQLQNGQNIDEREVYTPGDTPTMVEINGWRIGLSICYDLRFPELYRTYANRGADIIVAPSNFTQSTGAAHWELLTRTRAVENQCFLLAPNQCGTNPDSDVESYGNSIAVDPWGEVLCRADDTPCILTTVLDPGALRAARETVPALHHRRF